MPRWRIPRHRADRRTGSPPSGHRSVPSSASRALGRSGSPSCDSNQTRGPRASNIPRSPHATTVKKGDGPTIVAHSAAIHGLVLPVPSAGILDGALAEVAHDLGTLVQEVGEERVALIAEAAKPALDPRRVAGVHPQALLALD